MQRSTSADLSHEFGGGSMSSWETMSTQLSYLYMGGHCNRIIGTGCRGLVLVHLAQLSHCVYWEKTWNYLNLRRLNSLLCISNYFIAWKHYCYAQPYILCARRTYIGELYAQTIADPLDSCVATEQTCKSATKAVPPTQYKLFLARNPELKCMSML